MRWWQDNEYENEHDVEKSGQYPSKFKQKIF